AAALLAGTRSSRPAGLPACGALVWEPSGCGETSPRGAGGRRPISPSLRRAGRAAPGQPGASWRPGRRRSPTLATRPALAEVALGALAGGSGCSWEARRSGALGTLSGPRSAASVAIGPDGHQALPLGERWRCGPITGCV
ncbi:MAG TPA: hypothetical protein VFS21_40165, partial [Roseiflexaceae bacterium]|nr:hypothetical protein [Roseiflexaceae bacterium]